PDRRLLPLRRLLLERGAALLPPVGELLDRRILLAGELLQHADHLLLGAVVDLLLVVARARPLLLHRLELADQRLVRERRGEVRERRNRRRGRVRVRPVQRLLEQRDRRLVADAADRRVDAGRDIRHLLVGGERGDQRLGRGRAAAELAQRVGRGDGKKVGEIAAAGRQVLRDRRRGAAVPG